VTVPVYNDKIVPQGLAKLTSAYITKPNVRAWLAAVLQAQQDLEDATFAVLRMRFLRTAQLFALPQTNIVFDTIGKIVGIGRGVMSDLQYQSAIFLEVAVNRSNGNTTDWSRFGAILTPFIDALIYLDCDMASFYFGLWNLQLDPNIIGSSLTRAVPNGVYGELAYTVWPDGSDFEWSSFYDSTAGELGWGSVYDTTVGGLLAASIAMVPTPNGGNILGYVQ
jgi:hypothetical protein